MKLLEAAKLMETGYEYDRQKRAGASSADLKKVLQVSQSYNVDGVQAYFLPDKTLLVPGSNEVSDYPRYNLKTEAIWSQNLSKGTGASGTKWHAGFLDHARAVYNFVVFLNPKRLIGHSLGAASVQIAGASLGVPTIAFASPRTKFGRPYFKGEGWVVNINRTDDIVCRVPPRTTGFRHLGSQYWVRPAQNNPGEDHSMKNYVSILQDNGASNFVPKQWPIDG